MRIFFSNANISNLDTVESSLTYTHYFTEAYTHTPNIVHSKLMSYFSFHTHVFFFSIHTRHSSSPVEFFYLFSSKSFPFLPSFFSFAYTFSPSFLNSRVLPPELVSGLACLADVGGCQDDVCCNYILIVPYIIVQY